MERKTLGRSGKASFSQGLKVTGQELVFISGQVARDATGAVVAPDNLPRQAEFIFESMRKLLEEAGASFRNVVKITAFVTTLDDYAAYGAIRKRIFGDDLPTSSTVQVTSLVTPGCVIEIEAIAVL